ncbi:DNA-binding transcriptional regulator DsdC [Vibrio kasasachensis]|uniref:DNA-binding transcriptional regulator DsdC n=1 Tax=Vibrio kasasachensis TaxID=2910248 RepID=UPI003D0E1D1D
MYTRDNIFTRNERINSFQLSKLHTFEVAARHSSFSLAAEELSMTPSAISHRINKLELELGIALFHRTHRKITLTEEGERIYQSLTRSLNEINQEILDVKSGDISGSLTIYSRPSFAQCWLVPRLYEFNQRYPFIELKLLTGNENIKFQGYGIDAAIYFDEGQPDNVWSQEIMSETNIPVCTAEYAEQHSLFNKPENLINTTLLHDNQAWDYDSHHDEWAVWARANQLPPIDHISSIAFDRSDLAVIAAMNHAGIAMGRYNLNKKRLDSGELVAPFQNTEVTCQQKYYLVTPNKKHSRKLALFIEWLMEAVDTDKKNCAEN